MPFNSNYAMKTHLSRRKNGFTLVELLVVIAIIAVLAAAGFSAGLAAIQKAKRTTCQATCVAIEASVNNFFTEYGSMPNATMVSDTTVDTTSSTGLDFVDVLIGSSSTQAVALNTRSIKFLSVREGKYLTATKGINGLVYKPNTSTIIGLFDPWGGKYSVMLDGDYDEILKVKTKADSATTTLNGKRVAVWSDGADGVTATGKSADDVKTW